jgi:S1-C subfamily serine protease
MNNTTVKAGGNEMYQDEDGYYHSYPPQSSQSSPNGAGVDVYGNRQGASEHYGQQPPVNEQGYQDHTYNQYNQSQYNQPTPGAWPTSADSYSYAPPQQNSWPQAYTPSQQQSWQPPYTPPQQNGWQPPYTPASTPRPVSPVPPRSTRSGGWRAGSIALLALVVLVIFGVGLFAGWQFVGSSHTTGSSTTTSQSGSNTSTGGSTTASSSSVQSQQESAIAKIEPSVVELDVTVPQGEQIGSGVIIDNNGDIVTNNHVVNGGQSIKVILNNGNTETGQLIGTVANDDLAIVRIQPFSNMKVATIGDSSKLTVGQEVLAVGNPLGITETATNGIISALNRSVSESDSNSGNGPTISNAIQTDAPINPGNSGGALIDLNGNLVGVPTLTAVNTESNTPANGVGFAIPSNTVKDAINQILHQ